MKRKTWDCYCDSSPQIKPQIQHDPDQYRPRGCFVFSCCCVFLEADKLILSFRGKYKGSSFTKTALKKIQVAGLSDFGTDYKAVITYTAHSIGNKSEK